MVVISLICIPQTTVKARITANINYDIQRFFSEISLCGFMKILYFSHLLNQTLERFS